MPPSPIFFTAFILLYGTRHPLCRPPMIFFMITTQHNSSNRSRPDTGGPLPLTASRQNAVHFLSLLSYRAPVTLSPAIPFLDQKTLQYFSYRNRSADTGGRACLSVSQDGTPLPIFPPCIVPLRALTPPSPPLTPPPSPPCIPFDDQNTTYYTSLRSKLI